MSFEYSIEKDCNPKKLTKEQENAIVTHIAVNFKDWDNARHVQKDIYLALKPEIYLEERTKHNTWKSQKKLNKIYSLYQTRQAGLWETLYSDIKRMFDVDGKTIQSEETAKAQKKALTEAFDKMKVTQQLDKAVEWLDSVGEFCLFVGWKKIYKQIRRPLTFAEALNQGKLIKLLKKETVTGIFEEMVYDGAYVEAINPLNLVFDPTIRPEIENEWDRGGKIIKTFKTYEQIASNKIYQLSKEALFEIKNSILNKKVDEVKDDSETVGEIFDQDKIEVLEYWGDYVLEGKTLKNYVIAVIGRTHLARFIENPFIINPIINVATSRQPDTKRGIPCLYSVLDIAKAQEEDVNEVKDVQQLNKNPARYAPQGLFEKTKTQIEPGLIIEYQRGVDEPNAIIPIQVALLNADTQIQFLDRAISEISGIFPNMMGQEENKDATATELKIKVAGQTTRLSKDIDTLKQNGIIKMVEKVADLLANEKNGKTEELFFRENGKLSAVTINDAVRQGTYEYKYSDGSSLAAKKAQFNETINLIKAAAQIPEVAATIDWNEVLTYGLQTIGLENTDKFFKTNDQPLNNNSQIPQFQFNMEPLNGNTQNQPSSAIPSPKI